MLTRAFQDLGPAWAWPLLALAGLAVVQVTRKSFFWMKYFLRRDRALRRNVIEGRVSDDFGLLKNRDPVAQIALRFRVDPLRGRLLAERLVSRSQRGLGTLSTIAALSAGVGLAGLVIRVSASLNSAAFVPPVLTAHQLSIAFYPMAAGLLVYFFSHASVGFFRFLSEGLKSVIDQAATAVSVAAAGTRQNGPLAGVVRSETPQAPPAERAVPSPSAACAGDAIIPHSQAIRYGPPARRRRFATRDKDRTLQTLKGLSILTACMVLSVSMHLMLLLAAKHLSPAASAAQRDQREGVFLASLREPDQSVTFTAEQPKPEVPPVTEPPPPPPPPPPPVPKEPPPPEPPKVDPSAPLTEKPAAPVAEEAPRPASPQKPEPAAPPAPAAEKPKPDPAPEAPVAEAPKAPPPPKAEEEKKSAPAEERPAEAAPPSTNRFTESAKAPEDSREKPPLPADPLPPPKSKPDPAPAAAPNAGPDALGFGRPDPSANRGPSGGASKEKASGAEVSSLTEYRQFLAREMKSGAREGQYVPNLRFGDNRPDENREIMRYFGMELIAYPKSQKFYIYIDADQSLFSQSNDFSYIHNFSNRVIFRTSPYFNTLRKEAARRAGVDPEDLVVAQLLKPGSAAYIGWKEGECARRAGVALEDVEACEATFAKSPFGAWIVRIDTLLLKSGGKVQVRDFEWAKVSGGKGAKE